MNRYLLCCFLGIGVTFLSCKDDPKKHATLFQLMEAGETGIDFSNDLVQTDSFSIVDYMYFFNGGGVGVGDINNDGLADLYFTGNLVSSRLYLNKGNFKFEDITASAGVTTQGWCTGIAMADVNADGFTDLYVSRAGSTRGAERSNLLFLNNKNNTFSEIADASGIADTSYTTQSAFFDYDRDGDLDLFVLNHDHAPKTVNNPLPIRTKGQAKNTDKLFRNLGNDADGRPRFENVSREAGIQIEGFGLGVAIHDLNNDGWPDVYVANDFLSPDNIYINNHDGTFTDRAAEYLKHQSYNSMGVDIADYNNDGLEDIMVMDMLPDNNTRQKMMIGGMTNEKFDFLLSMNYPRQYMRNTLQLNQGDNRYSEIAQLAGVDRTDWSWSPLFADLDNDGWKDLFITNGYFKDITDRDFIMFTNNKTMFTSPKEANKILVQLMEKQGGVHLPNVALKNNTDLTFSKQTKWGFDKLSFSNGAAYADLDNDGDLDLIINNINEKAFVYKNDLQHGDSGHYLQISLQGNGGNRLALGTKIKLYADGHQQYYEHTVFRGYQSTVDNIIHFGLGKSVIADSIDVEWPDGTRSFLRRINADQRQIIKYGEGSRADTKNNSHTKPYFTNITKQSGGSFLHVEDLYSDLTAFPLLPQSYSGAGPSLAAGDVDGNGLDDFYVGGSSESKGVLMLQTATGKFKKSPFTASSGSDDAGSLLIDVDNDGDLDLITVAGSDPNESNHSSGARLWLNDGKGNYKPASDALPTLPAGCSIVAAADFDRDGDLDLFVGGRVSPEQYPVGPGSHLLQNDRGKFSDITSQACAALQTAGMVTTAIWTDFDNDDHLDLIVAGEWMPITFYRNENNKLVDVTGSTGLETTTGWWNSISGGDFDNDGDIDYLLGNVGHNIPFRDGDKKTVSLYYGELDGTAPAHAMLAWTDQGVDYPWQSKDVLYKLMPRFSKRFLKYSEYSHATMADLLKNATPDKSKVLRAEQLSSSYVENLGNGKFRLKPLPVLAQVAPVNGILVDDFDNDGNLDALLTGNQYNADVSIGRYDAFAGLYLKGDGRGAFIPQELSRSGFNVDADGRALISLSTGESGSVVVSAANSDSLRVFSFPDKRKSVRVKAGESYALIKNSKTDTKRKVELYYGSGYLSQSSSVVRFSPEIESLEIRNFKTDKE